MTENEEVEFLRGTVAYRLGALEERDRIVTGVMLALACLLAAAAGYGFMWEFLH